MKALSWLNRHPFFTIAAVVCFLTDPFITTIVAGAVYAVCCAINSSRQ